MTDEQKRLIIDLRVRLVAIESHLTQSQVKVMVSLALESIDTLITSMGETT